MQKEETARSGEGGGRTYLFMQEARRAAGRQLRRRREEEKAWAKALDRAATAVAAIAVGTPEGGRRERIGEGSGVIYIGAIKKKDASYLHAIKKFGDTSMP
jgi:S1-C subfamily serine protease